MRLIFEAALLAVIASYAVAAEPCDSFRDAKGRSVVDFAPPAGFIDVCSRDAQLCTQLTKGYPPSVQTIGYFVREVEWQRYQKGELKGFEQYFIAQRAQTMSPADFAELKQYVRRQQGSIPDHTELPRALESQGRVSIGVTGETDDSISYGVVMRLAGRGEASSHPLMLAAINTALQVKGETLSLYAFDTVSQPTEVKGVTALANSWVACLRKRNAR